MEKKIGDCLFAKEAHYACPAPRHAREGRLLFSPCVAKRGTGKEQFEGRLGGGGKRKLSLGRVLGRDQPNKMWGGTEVWKEDEKQSN